ncbi:relaxase/mobilization nuclease domain-containing protein [Ethanoligenens sp.]
MRSASGWQRNCGVNSFEVVVPTHLDKHHLHNHYVLNSVSCIDGK